MDKTNYQLVAEMHKKFGLHEPQLGPRVLNKEEVIFRITAMHEELMEYVGSVFDGTINIQLIQTNFRRMLESYELSETPDVAEQFDALLDLAVFAIGTADRQNLPWDNGFDRVMEANIAKELGANGDKRGGFKRDLVKPEGWEPPVLNDLVMDQARVAAGVQFGAGAGHNPEDLNSARIDLAKDEINHRSVCGLIILDGPDCAGKTTLADEIAKQHAGVIVHRTWDPSLENIMDQYLMDPINLYHEGDLLIIDRNVLSEWIYSSVYREGTKWRGFHRLALEKLESLNALHIVCVPNNKADWMRRLQNEQAEGREEMYKADHRLGQVYNFYKDIISTDGDLSMISPSLKLNNFFHYDMQSTDAIEFAKSTVPMLLKGAK